MYDLARSDPAASADHIASGRYNSCSTSFSATFGLGIYAGSVFVFERANGMVHQFGVGGLSTGIRASASITEGAGEVVIGEFSDLEGFDLSGSGSLIVGGGGTVDWPLGEAPDVNRGYGFDVGAGLNMGAQNYLRSIPIEVVRESLPEVYQAFSYERSVDCVSTDVGDDPNFYP